MPKISITFDPATDSAATVAELVSRIYGNRADTIAPEDRPDVGETQTAPTDASGAIVLDKNGLPWDKRIHSDPASMTDKGVWRKKRGVDEVAFNAVAAELRAAQPAQPPLPPAAAAGVTPPPTLGLPALTPPAPKGPTPYETFVNFLAEHMHGPANPTGRLTEDYVKTGLVGMGVASGEVPELQTATPDQIGAISNAFRTALGLPTIA